MWWDSLTAVDQNSLNNVDRLVSVGEAIKTGEVDAWADAGRRSEDIESEDKGDTQSVGRESANSILGNDYQQLQSSA